MQMRKREMSPCRVPCHLGRMGLVVVVDGGGGAVVAGVVVAGAEVVAEEPEQSWGCKSQTWGWPEGQRSYGDMFAQASAESMGRRRRHDTLRNARPEHEGPGG